MTRMPAGLIIPDSMIKPRQGVSNMRCSTCGVFQTDKNSVRRKDKNYCFDSGCKRCVAVTSHIRNLLDRTKPELQEILDKNLEICARIQVIINTENTRPSEIAREYYRSTVKFVAKEDE